MQYLCFQNCWEQLKSPACFNVHFMLFKSTYTVFATSGKDPTGVFLCVIAHLNYIWTAITQCALQLWFTIYYGELYRDLT